LFFTCIVCGALIIAFAVGILIAFMLPAWLLIIIEALLIIALGCLFLRR